MAITIFPTGLTYSRNTKAPLMDKQIFDTLALAQAYVDDVDQTAYVGLTISVVADGDNNGLYYVDRVADTNNATGLLTKIGSDADTAIADLRADVTANTEALANKAEKFTVGNGLSYTDNKIDVVVSTAEGNSLSVDENGLYVAVPTITVPEYTLDSVGEPDASYAAQYQFKKDGVVLNTINIPKDQFLKSATFHATAEEGVTETAPYLKFVWLLDTDSETEGDQTITYVPVNDLVDVYTAGSYITIDANQISVDYNALKEKINTDLVANVVTRVSAVEQNVTNLQTSVSDIKVKDVDTTAVSGINLSLTEGKVGVSVNMDTLAAEVISKHTITAADVATTAAVGPNEVGASVQTVLENLDSRITAAVSGGVTSVAAGNGIAVDVTDVNNPKVSVNVVSGSALTASADGLDLVWTEI